MANFFVQPVVGKKARAAIADAGLKWPADGVVYGVYRRNHDGRVIQVGIYELTRGEADAAMAEAEKHWTEKKLDTPVKASNFPRLQKRK